MKTLSEKCQKSLDCSNLAGAIADRFDRKQMIDSIRPIHAACDCNRRSSNLSQYGGLRPSA